MTDNYRKQQMNFYRAIDTAERLLSNDIMTARDEIKGGWSDTRKSRRLYYIQLKNAIAAAVKGA